MNTYRYVRKIRIYPTHNQKESMDFWFRRCKILHNVALEHKISYYKRTNKFIGAYDQKKELKDIKIDDPTWAEIPNKSLQDVILNIDKSFKSFFNKKSKFPKFKSQLNSIGFVRTDVRLKDNKIYIPKIKTPIKYKDKGIIENGYTSIRLKKEHDKYYLLFNYEYGIEETMNNGDIIGIDLGLKSLYTNSNGYSHKRFSKKLIKKYNNRISELNNSLSTKKGGSKKRRKVIYQLNKAYTSLKNTKKDYLHKSANKLLECDEDIIVVGDIKVQKIISKSNKGLIKGFYNSSLGIFKEMLEYKGKRKNKIVKFVNERYTSKTCSSCGNLKHNLVLSDRWYECNKCDNSIDRDVNAAINMKLLGQSIPI